MGSWVVGWDLVGLVGALEDALDMQVEVEARATGDEPWIRLMAGTDSLYTVRLRRQGSVLIIGVARDPDHDVGAEPDLAATLLVVLAMRAGGDRIDEVVVRTSDPIMRVQARRLGFAGDLRGPLTRAHWSVDGPGASADPDAEGVGTRSPDLIAGLVGLLPGIEVRRVARRSRLRAAAKAAETGFAAACEIDVALPGDARPLRVVLTDRPDLLVEQVALAADTTLAVRRRFGAEGSCLRTLSFIRTDRSYRNGRVAGMAHSGTGLITLNGGYLTPGGTLDLNLRRRARGAARRAPAGLTDPGFAPLDGVVAHECWHVLDGRFQLDRYADTVEFRRRLGRYFGVETLEQALYGRERKAPPDQRLAYGRLVEEVSAYATTTLGEATAEMFKLWWCTPNDPPPIARLFGELLHDFFDLRD